MIPVVPPSSPQVGLLNYDETVRGVPAAGESLSVVVFLANLALVAACLAAYSRASLATRLGVDEHAPPREFAAALWGRLRGRGGGGSEGRGGGGGGRGKGGRTTAHEESSA